MTARRPGRSRRRKAPAPSLPRPSGSEVGITPDSRPSDESGAENRIQVHHVTADYGYVKSDLVTIAAVSVVSFGFIFAIALLV